MTKILRFPSFLFASACFLQFDFTNAACLLANRCKSRRTQTKTVARFRPLRRHHPVQQLMLSPQSVRERDDSTSAVASRDSHCPRIIHGQSMIAFSPLPVREHDARKPLTSFGCVNAFCDGDTSSPGDRDAQCSPKNERTSMSSEQTEYPSAPDFRSHPRRNKPPGGAQLLVQRHAVRFVGHHETPVFPGVVHVNRVAKLVDEDVAHQ